MAVVLVTGCSSGLGRSVALRLARRGERVYATMRHAERGKVLHDEAAAEGLDLEVLELDVTSDESVRDAVDRVLERDGTVDVVVNNAGIAHLGSVELLPDALMRDTFETNVFGPLRLLRAVLPTMRARGSGTVVNVSSCAGRVGGLPIHGSYMASKHALSVLSDSLAAEVKPFGIRVVCIEPGFFRTPIFTKSTVPTDADSPYRTLDEAVVRFMFDGVDGGADTDAVAAAVLDAIDHDDGRIHFLVGDDAEAFVAQDRASTDAELQAFYAEVLGVG
ncbi:MAG TPA: SDR family oxidoreductase [Acidimicrobiia bacterium]|nr:SDR family oxidoreductase [Acidimicrobiia bacterium]